MGRSWIITESNYDVFNILGVYDNFHIAQSELGKYRKTLYDPEFHDYNIVGYEKNELNKNPLSNHYMNKNRRN